MTLPDPGLPPSECRRQTDSGKKLFWSVVLAGFILTQGCAAQILGEQLQRGELVREEGTGAYSEQLTRHEIELLSPLSVRVSEEHASVEITKRYFQKIVIRQEARAKHYPYLDFWVKLLAATTVVPVLFPDFWVEGSYLGVNCRQEPEACLIRDVAHRVPNDYFVESGSRSYVESLHAPSSATVGFYVNGRYQGELPLDSRGTATVNLANYPETAVQHDQLKLTFRYGNAYAYSMLQPDAGKKAPGAAPLQH